MSLGTTALPITQPGRGVAEADVLLAGVEPEFLRALGWSPETRLLTFPGEHPLLGMPVCRVTECVMPSAARGLCSGCLLRWRQRGKPGMEDFVGEKRPRRRQVGVADCTVSRCERPVHVSLTPLCSTHLHQFRRRKVALERFVELGDVVPLPGFGRCAVVACHRRRPGTAPYCHAHQERLAHALRQGLVDSNEEERWRRTAPPVTENHEISLRGLSDQLVAEVLYALHARTCAGLHTGQSLLRTLLNHVREREIVTLTAVDLQQLSHNCRGFCNSLIQFLQRAGKTPESERHKDVWDGAVFGHAGRLHFTDLHQPWLREAVKEWAYTALPQRRGKAVSSIQEVVRAFALLSASLRLQRDDAGESLADLSRQDIIGFLNRLAFLQSTEVLSAHMRVRACRAVRRHLAQMRSLGLTRPGRPLHGMPEDFALLAEDMPDDPEDTEAGKDLPLEVMRHLCAHLPSLVQYSRNGNEYQTATELLIDTGRRPNEICGLPLNCLSLDNDGQHELVYDNNKAYRKGRRLPISKATAGVIIQQQERVRAAFPHTPDADLVLLPTSRANPHGRKSISTGGLSESHRTWVDSLPDVLVSTRVESDGRTVTRNLPFDKIKIFPYAYRHTYCQRHADAGVQPDVLRELMDHRVLDTTQAYYDPRELHQTGENPQVGSSGRRVGGLQRCYELAV